MRKKNNSLYELILVTKHDSPYSDLNKIWDLCQKANVTNSNAIKLEKKEYWGIRSLAYPIKKVFKATYSFLVLRITNSSIVKNLSKLLSNNDLILRHSLVSVKSFSKEPSPILQSIYDAKSKKKTFYEKSDESKNLENTEITVNKPENLDNKKDNTSVEKDVVPTKK